MLNLFQKYRRPTENSPRVKREDFVKFFFEQPEHAWITQHAQAAAVFHQCLSLLPSALVTTLLRQPLVFVPSEVFRSEGAHRYQLNNTVVVFPEFQKLLKKGSREAVAFVAHEIALVLYELDPTADKDPLMAEVEADKFVCDLGLADELEALLLAMDEGADKRLRLTYLTLKAFGIN